MAGGKNMPGTEVKAGYATNTPVGKVTSIKEGHLEVNEVLSTRAAAPSPFGDDQTFPLPVENLTYMPTVSP